MIKGFKLPYLLFFLIISYNIYYLVLEKNNFNSSFEDPVSEVVDLIKSYKKNESKLFVQGAHIYRYYSGNQKIIDLHAGSSDNPGFFERINYEYKDRSEAVFNKEYDLIVLLERIGYKEDTLSALKKAGYREIKIPEHKVFVLQDD